MHSSMLLALVASGASIVVADGVTSAIYPSPSEKAGCQYSLGDNGNPTAFAFVQSSLNKRQIDTTQQTDCSYIKDGKNTLVSHLQAGVLTDNYGRTAYIAGENNQVQYDDPPQSKASLTAGWSVCAGGVLALGDTTTFFNCDSGNLVNIYNETQGAQCKPFNYIAISCAPGTVPSFKAPSSPVIGAANLDGSANSNSGSSSSSSSSATSSTSTTSAESSASAISSEASSAPSIAASSTAATPASGAASASSTGAASTATGSPISFTGSGAVVQAAQSVVGLVAAGVAFALL